MPSSMLIELATSITTMSHMDHSRFSVNRRAFLGRYAGALGTLALAQLARAGQEPRALGGARAACSRAWRMWSRVPGRGRSARSVICLFQHGGPSQMDLFDPKPALSRHHGKPYPGSLEIHFDKQAGKLLASPFRFRPQGKSGMVLSELMPHISGIADDLTLVRSMATESVDHEAALRLIHTGKILAGRPTWGSWVVYALGSENQNLPAYVVLSDPGGLPVDGVRNWSNGWLPAIDQGTPFRSGATPVLNLKTPEGVTAEARKCQLRFLNELNQAHQEASSGRLGARGTDRELRDRRGDANGGARGARSLAGISRDQANVRTGQPGDTGIRQPLPDCPPAGRARRAVRAALSEWSTVGYAQQECRDAQISVRRKRSAKRCSGSRSESSAVCWTKRS